MPRTFFTRATFTGLALALGLGIALPAQAQEGTLLRDIFGRIGIMEPEQPQIEYRERAPLVVPPSRDLPPPRAPEQIGGAPNWPQDRRDRVAREEQRELERYQDQVRSGDGVTAEVPNLRLPRGAGTAPRIDLNNQWGDEPPPRLTREQREAFQRQMRGDGSEAQGLTRRSLTDPPSHFLQPAPRD
ncbi:MAG: hypothetical protein JJU21_06785 [Salinarimonas sp.]|nr:hypothetical protein [Salinarimonas sp.]